MFSNCLFYSFSICRNAHLQGVCKFLYRVSEAPAATVSSQALLPLLGTTQELKCIMAREWRGCRGSSWGAPAISSFRVVYRVVLGPPTAFPGHHTLLHQWFLKC